MYNFIRNKSATVGLLAVMFLFVLPVSALTTGASLGTSAVGDDSSSATPSKQRESETPSYESSASGTQPWKAPLLKLQALLGTLRVPEDVPSKDDAIITSDDMSSVYVAKVSDMSATLVWSSPKLTKVTVYYSSTSPVLVSDKIPSASPWKFWNSKQVTLRGLSPDTVYHYKVVAVTALGTTTSAEASFKTVAR